MVKNCDRGLENATLGLRPRAVFSRPRSQFFTIRTSQPANNIYLWNSHLDYNPTLSSNRSSIRARKVEDEQDIMALMKSNVCLQRSLATQMKRRSVRKNVPSLAITLSTRLHSRTVDYRGVLWFNIWCPSLMGLRNHQSIDRFTNLCWIWRKPRRRNT